MPNPFLVGNGAWCSTCFPAGQPNTGGSFVEATRWNEHVRRGCNECAGRGRVAFTREQIVEATLAERRAWLREQGASVSDEPTPC